MKHELTKYFKHRMKLELSQEKTYATDLMKGGYIFLVTSSRRSESAKRLTLQRDGTSRENHAGHGTVVQKDCQSVEQVHVLSSYLKAQHTGRPDSICESIILGAGAILLSPSICSHAYHAIDRRVKQCGTAPFGKSCSREQQVTRCRFAENTLQSSAQARRI
ncbi:MAG: hypothetical protein ACLUS6_11860 [Dysosmobacter sp.]